MARIWRNGSPCALTVDMQDSVAAVTNRGGSPKKVKIKLPHDPAISLMGVYPKALKARTQACILTPV